MILSLAALEISVGLVVLSWLARVAFDPSYKFRSTPLDLPVLIFFVLRLLSVLSSVEPGASQVFFWKEAPFFVFFFALTQTLDVKNENLLSLVFLCFLIGAFIGSVHGIYVHFTEGYARARSVTSGYMTLGMYLTAIMALTLPSFEKLLKPRSVVWGVFVVSLLALLFTLNRTHLIIIACVLLLIGVVRYRRLLWLAPAIFIVAYALSPALGGRLSTLSSPVTTSSDRNILWADAWERLLDHPFLGYGPYTFSHVFDDYDKLTDKLVGGWHNDYLQIPVESGFPSLLALLWVFGSSLYYCFRYRPWRGREWNARLSLGVGLMLASLYFAAFFGAGAFDVINAQLLRFGLAIAGLLPVFEKVEKGNPVESDHIPE